MSPTRTKPLGRGMITLGLLALAALAFGAALLPFTMFGLLGFPVVLGAAIGCIVAALGLGRTASISPWKNMLGIGLIVLGVVVLVFAIRACVFAVVPPMAWMYGSKAMAVHAKLMDGGQWVVFGTLLLVSPSLVVLGVACRTGWSRQRSLYLYGVLLGACLLAALLFLLMAWIGFPLGA